MGEPGAGHARAEAAFLEEVLLEAGQLPVEKVVGLNESLRQPAHLPPHPIPRKQH